MEMKKIRYHYTNLPKQALFVVGFLYILLRFLVIMEIIVFRLDGFYENLNIPLTLLMYAALFALLWFLFRGHKLCYSTYDENTLVYHNTLLRRTRTLELSTVKLAVFDTFGVKFYDHTGADWKKEKPMFFLPFFRDGIVEAIDINEFFKMMKSKEGVEVFKNFKVLPGYTKKWNALAVAYGFVAVVAFMSLATPLTVVIVLFQSH